MSDNEIIKALECCIKEQCSNCCNCGNWHEQWNCMTEIMKKALDLINRQKAEIERLKKDNEYILMQHKFQRRPSGDCWNDVIEKAKAEAVKEFAERLKELMQYEAVIYDCHIDNLVKEMAEENI